MRPARHDVDRQRDDNPLAEQSWHEMLRSAQRNRRFADLVERQASQQEESREKRADLAMAQSLRDTAQQLEAQVRDLASRGLFKGNGSGGHPPGSTA
jgi:hypothetical protein